jgi:hypothetical protein
MSEEGTVVSRTLRPPMESRVRQINGPKGELFWSEILWQGGVIRKEGPFFDADEATAKADQMREELFREKFASKK